MHDRTEKSSFNNVIFEYKEPVVLAKYLSEGGKIIPARISELNTSQQRRLKNAIKKAQSIALLPIGTQAYNVNKFPEPISPKPYSF